MINDDDFMPMDFMPIDCMPSNIKPINDKQFNDKQLKERLAMEASDYLLMNELFKNINDASTNDTPIINNKINVIAEKIKKAKRDNIVKDLISNERHTPRIDKRSRFTNNLKKDKLLDM